MSSGASMNVYLRIFSRSSQVEGAAPSAPFFDPIAAPVLFAEEERSVGAL